MAMVQTTDPTVRAAFEAIARDVLGELAPQEAPLFAAASKAYIDNPEASGASMSRDRVLGFGSDLGAVFMTPIVLRAVSGVFETLTTIAGKAVQDGVSGEVSELVRAMFAKFRGPRTKLPSVLTREQLAMVHRQVSLTARNLHLPPDQARSLADAVTARLVLAKE